MQVVVAPGATDSGEHVTRLVVGNGPLGPLAGPVGAVEPTLAMVSGEATLDHMSVPASAGVAAKASTQIVAAASPLAVRPLSLLNASPPALVPRAPARTPTGF